LHSYVIDPNPDVQSIYAALSFI